MNETFLVVAQIKLCKHRSSDPIQCIESGLERVQQCALVQETHTASRIFHKLRVVM